MYIKSLVIDGFKSYGHRTEVKGFDPEFNAITGLNGTGKSNILDSICFVLGISNLSQVSFVYTFLIFCYSSTFCYQYVVLLLLFGYPLPFILLLSFIFSIFVLVSLFSFVFDRCILYHPRYKNSFVCYNLFRCYQFFVIFFCLLLIDPVLMIN